MDTESFQHLEQGEIDSLLDVQGEVDVRVEHEVDHLEDEGRLAESSEMGVVEACGRLTLDDRAYQARDPFDCLGGSRLSHSELEGDPCSAIRRKFRIRL